MATTSDTLLHKELKPYPPAEAGMKRLVIVMDGAGKNNPGGGPVPGEREMEVELIAGARIMTDGSNRYWISASIEEGTVQGWGYPFWKITGDPKSAASTRMMPRPGQSEERFVSGASLKIRYNSRLPVVVYCPVGMECHYRIWKVASDEVVAGEG